MRPESDIHRGKQGHWEKMWRQYMAPHFLYLSQSDEETFFSLEKNLFREECVEVRGSSITNKVTLCLEWFSLYSLQQWFWTVLALNCLYVIYNLVYCQLLCPKTYFQKLGIILLHLSWF